MKISLCNYLSKTIKRVYTIKIDEKQILIIAFQSIMISL